MEAIKLYQVLPSNFYVTLATLVKGSVLSQDDAIDHLVTALLDTESSRPPRFGFSRQEWQQQNAYLHADEKVYRRDTAPPLLTRARADIPLLSELNGALPDQDETLPTKQDFLDYANALDREITLPSDVDQEVIVKAAWFYQVDLPKDYATPALTGYSKLLIAGLEKPNMLINGIHADMIDRITLNGDYDRHAETAIKFLKKHAPSLSEPQKSQYLYLADNIGEVFKVYKHLHLMESAKRMPAHQFAIRYNT